MKSLENNDEDSNDIINIDIITSTANNNNKRDSRLGRQGHGRNSLPAKHSEVPSGKTNRQTRTKGRKQQTRVKTQELYHMRAPITLLSVPSRLQPRPYLVGFVEDGMTFDSLQTAMMSGACPPPAPSLW